MCSAASRTWSSLASGLAVADVFAHRAGKEERLLRHQPDVPAILARSRRRMSRPSIKQLAALELVKARDQLGDAALARAGVPDQRDRFLRAGYPARNRGSTISVSV